MERGEARVVAVLEELAELGRRIGERAGELARLTDRRRRDAAPGADGGVRSVVIAAEGLAAEAAAVVGRPVPSRGTKRETSGGAPATRATPARIRGTAGPKGSDPPHDRRSASLAPSRPRRACPPPASPGAGWRRPGRRSVGPVLASVLVHAVALCGLATVFVVVEAKPIRLALTVGSVAESSFEEAALIAIDGPEMPEAPVELLAADDPAVLDPLPSVEPPPLLSAALETADESMGPGTAALDPAALLAEIGAPGRAAVGGGAAGAATGSRRPAPTFFGRAGQGRSVCFICDNSNSHRDGSFHVVLEEVARAVEALGPDQSFFVIFASDAAYPLFHPDAPIGLQAATPDAKRRLRSWLGSVEMCRGGKGLDDAVALAASLGAEIVYLLSDGELGGSVVDRLEHADFGGAVVHTFGMQRTVVDRRTGDVIPDRLREQQGYDRNLTEIAVAHGGTFTPVVVAPAAASLERIRPIPRNRSRGAVWGLKL